jgi:hypothetical protein
LTINRISYVVCMLFGGFSGRGVLGQWVLVGVMTPTVGYSVNINKAEPVEPCLGRGVWCGGVRCWLAWMYTVWNWMVQ